MNADDCAKLATAADKLLARLAELGTLRIVNPREARKVAAQIETFEKRFSKFVAETEDIPKLRESAKAMLADFARFESVEGGLASFGAAKAARTEAEKTNLSKFLTDTEAIAQQREAAKEALLKFASARSLLNGERGN